MNKIHGKIVFIMSNSIQRSANSNQPLKRIALTRKLVPYDLDLGKDYTNTLRRMLEHALLAARSAERQVVKQKAEIDRLRTLSITDENTGLLNRRGFSEALARALARGHRYGEPAVLLLIDLDEFKATNDTFGHAAGDIVLGVVADALKKSVREVDDVARLGGDEFGVILNKLPETLADKQADAIEAQLNGQTVPWHGQKIRIRASVGRCCFGRGEPEEAQTIYESADSDMYLRKRLSRRKLGAERQNARAG